MAALRDIVIPSAPVVLTNVLQDLPGPILDITLGDGWVLCFAELNLTTPAVGNFALQLQLLLGGTALTSRFTPLTTNLTQTITILLTLGPTPGPQRCTFRARDTIDAGTTVPQNASRITIIELPLYARETFG